MSNTTPPKHVTLSIFERGSDMARRRGQRRGHLHEKSGWWFLRYRVDTADLDDAGKPQRERITVAIAPSSGPGAIGKREAQRVAWAEYLSKLDQASIRPSSMKTLQEFVTERFEPDVMASLKPSGRAHYEFILRKHVLPALGEVKLREIGVAHVQAIMNAKIKAGLSVQTAVHVRNCISAILRHAKAMQWFAGELPTEAVRLPEMKREERKALRWDQVCELSKLLPEPVATLVPFLALTGLRIGEAMGLRWKYVNLTDEFKIVDAEVIPPMCIAVRESFVMGRYQSLKSQKSSRNVPIPIWFAPQLFTLLSRTPWKSSDDPVFAAECGKPLDRHNAASRVLKPKAKEIGLGWASWHHLRHTHATLADMAGFSVTERQRLLGHSDQAMTLHYSHAELEQMRGRLEKMVDPKKLQ